MENDEKMKALLGDPQKIKLGEKEYTVEKLTMRKQLEVFNMMAKGFAEGEGSMMEKMGDTAIEVVSMIVGVPKEQIECPASDLMMALLKVWEVNNFDPLYQAVATLNKKVLRQ